MPYVIMLSVALLDLYTECIDSYHSSSYLFAPLSSSLLINSEYFKVIIIIIIYYIVTVDDQILLCIEP